MGIFFLIWAGVGRLFVESRVKFKLGQVAADDGRRTMKERLQSTDTDLFSHTFPLIPITIWNHIHIHMELTNNNKNVSMNLNWNWSALKKHQHRFHIHANFMVICGHFSSPTRFVRNLRMNWKPKEDIFRWKAFVVDLEIYWNGKRFLKAIVKKSPIFNLIIYCPQTLSSSSSSEGEQFVEVSF